MRLALSQVWYRHDRGSEVHRGRLSRCGYFDSFVGRGTGRLNQRVCIALGSCDALNQRRCPPARYDDRARYSIPIAGWRAAGRMEMGAEQS